MAKRQSVNFPGFAHQNPIPNASRIGNVMMTSVISGVDPGTRNLPPELGKQVTNLFTHVRTAIEAAGGTPDDILKMTFWMKEPATGRAALNDEPDYALSSAIKAWYKTGTYGCFCEFERWRATRCNFKRGSARPSLLFFTEQRISAGRR